MQIGPIYSTPICVCSRWGLPSRCVATTLVVSYTTVSAFLLRRARMCPHVVGVFFSAALSVGSGFGNNSCQIPSFRLAVSQHPALWSPDFPHGTCYNIAIVEVVPRSHPARFACVLYHMRECCVAGDALQGTPYGTYEWQALQLVQARRAGILHSVRARIYFYPRLLIFLIFCLLNGKNCATLTLVYVTYCRSVPCQIQPQLKAMPQATARSMLAKSQNKPNKNSSCALIWRYMLALWLCFMAYFSFLQ